MGKKTPPWVKYPEWTEARWWAFLRSGLRQMHMRWPPAQESLKEGRKAVVGKRHKFEYQCKNCLCWFPQKEVERDHAISCGTLKAYSDIPIFVEKLFTNKEGYQLLCLSCHKEKTSVKGESNE